MTLSQIGMSQTYLAFGIDNPVGIWRDLILIDMKIGKLPKYIKMRCVEAYNSPTWRNIYNFMMVCCFLIGI